MCKIYIHLQRYFINILEYGFSVCDSFVDVGIFPQIKASGIISVQTRVN